MLEATQYHLQDPPPGKHDAALFIPSRYLTGDTPRLSKFEESLLLSAPEAMAQFVDTCQLGALFPGELSVSRETDGWGAVVLCPMTVRQAGIESRHLYAPYARLGVAAFKVLLDMGFARRPSAYIALSDDIVGSSAVLRAAREEFENAQGYYCGLFAKPHFRGNPAFDAPIGLSGVIGFRNDSCFELGIGPLPRFGQRARKDAR